MENLEIEKPTRKQTRVIYVNIGQMTHQKAIEYVENLRAGWNLDAVFYENIIIPTRNSESRVEVFP